MEKCWCHFLDAVNRFFFVFPVRFICGCVMFVVWQFFALLSACQSFSFFRHSQIFVWQAMSRIGLFLPDIQHLFNIYPILYSLACLADDILPFLFDINHLEWSVGVCVCVWFDANIFGYCIVLLEFARGICLQAIKINSGNCNVLILGGWSERAMDRTMHGKDFCLACVTPTSKFVNTQYAPKVIVQVLCEHLVTWILRGCATQNESEMYREQSNNIFDVEWNSNNFAMVPLAKAEKSKLILRIQLEFAHIHFSEVEFIHVIADDCATV